jgi:hypothetical protein
MYPWKLVALILVRQTLHVHPRPVSLCQLLGTLTTKMNQLLHRTSTLGLQPVRDILLSSERAMWMLSTSPSSHSGKLADSKKMSILYVSI